MTAAEQKPATKPRPLRFSLRWLLGILTLAAVLLAYPASIVRQAAHEAAVLDAFARHQPNVVYRAQGPLWLQQWLGEENCRVVHRIDLRGRGVPKAIGRLREFKDLQDLRIGECDLCDEHVERIGVLSKVGSLWLYRVSITDRALETLAQYPRLEDVHLLCTQVSAPGVKLFQSKRQLRQLRVEGLTWAEWPRAGYTPLPAVVPTTRELARAELLGSHAVVSEGSIQYARLLGRQFNDGHVAAFEPDDLVRTLELSNTSITNEGLRHVAALPHLERLTCSGNQWSDDGFLHLSASPSLRYLVVSEDITAQGIEHLARLPNLTALEIRSSGVRNDSIAALAACPKLELLYLHGQNITSDAFADLAKIKTLKELSLAGTNVSNRRIAELTKLPHLNRLNLHATFVNDNGALQLASLKTLGYLGVGGQFFHGDTAARQRLKQAFPKTDVDFGY